MKVYFDKKRKEKREKEERELREIKNEAEVWKFINKKKKEKAIEGKQHRKEGMERIFYRTIGRGGNKRIRR